MQFEAKNYKNLLGLVLARKAKSHSLRLRKERNSEFANSCSKSNKSNKTVEDFKRSHISHDDTASKWHKINLCSTVQFEAKTY